MYGVFGAFTRWAVVFLVIFVLFFLLVPPYTAAVATGPAVTVTKFHGYNMMGGTHTLHDYDSPSSP
ncbi:MAG: hypothetical protein K6T26_04695 [Alicyclobacillus sp.]|nr:hypothetical protein [Alicyclobacillus sp.]